MSYTRQYKEFLVPELRTSRGEIKPRNIYRISTYKDGDPETKTGEDARYVFVIGKIDDKIHCIKLNDIKPLDFTNLLFDLRDKRVKVGTSRKLHILLKHFAIDGKILFEQYVKGNTSVYGPGKSNYRIYKIDKIVNVWEIQFEDFFLRKLFKEESTPSTRLEVIEEEIDDRDNTPTQNINSPR